MCSVSNIMSNATMASNNTTQSQACEETVSPGPEGQDVQSTSRGESEVPQEDYLLSKKPSFSDNVWVFDQSKWKIWLCKSHRTPENIQIIRKLGKPTCGEFYLNKLMRMRANFGRHKNGAVCSKCWCPYAPCPRKCQAGCNGPLPD